MKKYFCIERGVGLCSVCTLADGRNKFVLGNLTEAEAAKVAFELNAAYDLGHTVGAASVRYDIRKALGL